MGARCDGGDVAVAVGAAKDHRLYEWLSKKTQNKHGKGLDLKCRCGAANPTEDTGHGIARSASVAHLLRVLSAS